MTTWQKSKPVRPRLAMVICVRNEARFLAENLLYHHALGVERAYVYLDRCTDDSERIAASIPWAKVTRIAPQDGARFVYVPDMQVVCMNRALQQARDEGFDWLLTLDADEFAAAGNHAGRGRREQAKSARADLPRLLHRVKDHVDVIQLATRELLPLDLDPDEPFWKQAYFLTHQGHCRDILDPRDGTIKQLNGFYGHAYGKSILRTAADVQAFNPHEWTRNQGITYPDRAGRYPLRVAWRGYHLHYAIVDWRQWLDKHRKFRHVPNRWRSGGPVQFPKQCWKETVGGFTDAQASDYFGRWIATSEAHLEELVASQVVTRDRTVEQVLRESGVLIGDTLTLPRAPRFDSIEDWKMPDSFWQEGTNGIDRNPDGTVTYRISDLPTDQTQCLYGPFFNGSHRYRIGYGTVEVFLDVAPDDYAVTLHLPRWKAGRASIRLNGRTVCAGAKPDRQKTLKLDLTRRHFSDAERQRLEVEFHGTGLQRLAGMTASSGLSEIVFTPLRRAA